MDVPFLGVSSQIYPLGADAVISRRYSALCLSVIVSLFLLISCSAHSQEANARISGIVTDPSKAVITGANIVAVNIDLRVPISEGLCFMPPIVFLQFWTSQGESE